MRDCLAKKARDGQDTLKRAQARVDAALSRWDEDAKYGELAKARLAASNRTFAEYRKTQCAFAASLGGEAIGNALEIRRLACIAELDGRRATQLRDAVSDLPSK